MLQYFGQPDVKNWFIRKALMLGKIEDRRRRDNRGWAGWMASPTQWTWAWASSGSWWWTGKPGLLQSMGLKRVRHDWVTELNWTDGKSWLIGKDPDAGKDWRQEDRGTTEARWVDGITDSMDKSLSKLWEMLRDRESRWAVCSPWGNSQTRLSNWTTISPLIM